MRSTSLSTAPCPCWVLSLQAAAQGRGASSTQALEEYAEMTSKHSLQIRLIQRFGDLSNTRCPSPCNCGQEGCTGTEVNLITWAQGLLDACWRGWGTSLDLPSAAYIMSANIDWLLPSTVTTKEMCNHVHCLAGFHPVSIWNLSS